MSRARLVSASYRRSWTIVATETCHTCIQERTASKCVVSYFISYQYWKTYLSKQRLARVAGAEVDTGRRLEGRVRARTRSWSCLITSSVAPLQLLPHYQERPFPLPGLVYQLKGNFRTYEFVEWCNSMINLIEPKINFLSGFVLNPSDAALCQRVWNSDQCVNAEVRYYFDSTAKQCKAFKFANCLGNENIFPTEMECKARCSGLCSYIMLGHFKGHFGVTLCVCFKTSPRAKPFIKKYVWFTWKSTCSWNTFSYEWFRRKTYFDIESLLRNGLFTFYFGQSDGLDSFVIVD